MDNNKLDKKLPEGLLKAVLHAAEINYNKNEKELEKLAAKDAYLLAFINGYETAWSVYTDEDEEVLEKYGENQKTDDNK